MTTGISNHSICAACFQGLKPGVDPVYVRHAEDQCCWCEQWSHDGIYYRAPNATVPCQGEGGFHRSTPTSTGEDT